MQPNAILLNPTTNADDASVTIKSLIGTWNADVTIKISIFAAILVCINAISFC